MGKYIFAGLVFFFFSTFSVAQDMELEKTYEITTKAKRGNLAKADFEEGSQTYNLIYVTKTNFNTAKFETFSFDKDFNFLKSDNQELEFNDAKLKFPWWNFKGEEEIWNVAHPNLTGVLVINKIAIHYSWLLGMYLPYKTLEKVKPRSDVGEKHYFLSGATNEGNGELYIITGLKNDKDKYSYLKNIHFLRINNDLDVVKDIEIKFDYPQGLVVDKSFSDEDGNLLELVCLFAPIKKGDNPDPDKNKYTLIRVNANLEVLDRLSINSNSSFWAANEIVENPDDPNELVIYGPCYSDNDKYFDLLTKDEIEKTKFDAFQIMKIRDHQINYITNTELDEFASKIHTPASQRKTPQYRGKKFELADALILSNGDIIITGQNWGGKLNPITGVRQLAYKDIIGLHFGNTGNLLAQFGIDTKENNADFPTPQFVLENSDHNSAYWMICEVKGLKGEGLGFQLAGLGQMSSFLKKRLLIYPTMGRIDLNNNNVSEVKVYGEGKYFLDDKYPFIQLPNENKLILFGADKSGNTIWFARIRMD